MLCSKMMAMSRKPNVNVSLSLYRQAGHHELADRLVEIQFELTDRLAFYLCGRRPGNYAPYLYSHAFV